MTSRQAEPQKEIRGLENDFAQRIKALNEEHEKQVAAVNKEIGPKLTELHKIVRQAETDFETSREPLSRELNSFKGQFDFRQILEKIVPEDFRPKVIEVEGLQKEKLLLIQLKIAPEVGVIVWANEGHETKYSLKAGRNPIAQRRHLVCFCGNGCMTEEVRKQHLDTLSRICSENGIKVVFGRRIWHEQSGVQFRDGDEFELTVLQHCSKDAFERMGPYLEV
jgi:hypothetical protein